jgi:flagellar biogenesis protein FliO
MEPGQIAGAVGALGIVLGLVVLAGRLGRTRLASQEGAKALRLRATLALDTRRRLHLVDSDGGTLIVLTGGAQDRIMAWPDKGGGA